jgi:hypothetical protein
MNRAKYMILGDIQNIKSADAAAMAGSKAAQRRALEKRPEALANLAKKYSALSETQAEFIKRVKGASYGD